MTRSSGEEEVEEVKAWKEKGTGPGVCHGPATKKIREKKKNKRPESQTTLADHEKNQLLLRYLRAILADTGKGEKQGSQEKGNANESRKRCLNFQRRGWVKLERKKGGEEKVALMDLKKEINKGQVQSVTTALGGYRELRLPA